MPVFDPLAAFGLPPLGVIWPDFLLAFTFFTALSYVVLGQRFGRQPPTVAMSVALGSALALGFCAWEYAHDWSVRDLGPIALGFAVVVAAAVVYQAVQTTGGRMAGLALAIAAGVAMALTLGVPLLLDSGLLLLIALLGGLTGLILLLVHLRPPPDESRRPRTESVTVYRQLEDVRQERSTAELLTRRLHDLRVEAQWVGNRPELAEDIRLQLERILPQEGALTERLAQLRARCHHLRNGDAARFEQLRRIVRQLTPEGRQHMNERLSAAYEALRLDTRLERLDHAVAELERRVRQLTARAQQHLAAYDYRNVPALLEEAEHLQAHNVRLLRIIERTEARLLNAVNHLAAETPEVGGA